MGSYLFTLSSILFRAELALLAGLNLLIMLLLPGKQKLWHALKPYCTAIVLAVPLTVVLDSYMWQSRRPLWPELESVLFNVVAGRSSEWGTSGPLFYFGSCIPRLLLNPLASIVLIPRAICSQETRTKALAMLSRSLFFVSCLSLLLHKEWRFVIYVVPPLTVCAALGADSLWSKSTTQPFWKLVRMSLVGSVICSFALAFLMLGVSSMNYPGALALQAAHKHAMQVSSRDIIRIHMGNLACQTGVTQFGQEFNDQGVIPAQRWYYDKTEDPLMLRNPKFWDQLEYALVEAPDEALGSWKVVSEISAFKGIRWIKAGKAAELVNQTLDGRLSRSTVGRLLLMVVSNTPSILVVPAIRMETVVYVLENERFNV